MTNYLPEMFVWMACDCTIHKMPAWEDKHGRCGLCNSTVKEISQIAGVNYGKSFDGNWTRKQVLEHLGLDPTKDPLYSGD